MNGNVKVEFAPGCFDDFEGTQEELDAIINEINDLAKSGELSKIMEVLPFELEEAGYDPEELPETVDELLIGSAFDENERKKRLN
jgi:hypothetical protein